MSDPLIAPFPGWVVRPEWADRVIAGAYDASSPAQRRAIAAANPYSYVNVTRSPEDLAPGESATIDQLVTQGAAALTRLLEADAFRPSGRPALYLYRMTSMGRSQTGVVGTVPVCAFRDGRIRTHENVRPDRAALLTRHVQAVGATSSPIALTFAATEELHECIDALTVELADLDHETDGVRHQLWTVPAAATSTLAGFFVDSTLYVTDGHHRAAAADAACAAYGSHDPVLARTLAVAFPDDDIRIEAFHRIVADAEHRAGDELVRAIAAVAETEEVDEAERARPEAAGTVGMYVDGRWFRVALPAPAGDTAVDRLDVERLRATILDPVMRADELGQTGAVEYSPEPAGIAALVRRCDSADRVGFVLHPTSVADLMAVADAGQLMPPKSSYVAPKPRSGVFLRVLGRGATQNLPT